MKEGLLLKYGKIDKSTSHWVPISPFTILDKGVRDGIDYHTLEFDRRQIDLDDLVAPVNHVVVSKMSLETVNTINYNFKIPDWREV